MDGLKCKKTDSVSDGFITKVFSNNRMGDEIDHHNVSISEYEERYRLLVEASRNCVWEWDRIRNIEHFSERWMEISGYTREDMAGQLSWLSWIHPDDKERVINSLNLDGNSIHPSWTCEYRLKTKNGIYKWILVCGKATLDEEGKIYLLSCIHSDITEIKEYEDKLYKLLYQDTLTGLPNQIFMETMMDNLLNDDRMGKTAFLHIDCDYLKYVKNTLGISFADQLMCSIADRLKTFEQDDKILFKVGNDEFLFVHYGFNTLNEVKCLAKNLLECIGLPYEVFGNIFRITASIGISVCPENGRNSEELLKCSGVAMHKTINSRKNSYVFYDKDMDKEIQERRNIEKLLYTAIDYEELLVYYQPQIDLQTGKISGFEALLRWSNKELGFVLPDKFIPVAEDTQLIIPIGIWVLKKACCFIRELNTRGEDRYTIAVNVSMIQFMDNDFAKTIMEVLKEYELEPKYLELEITESTIMHSYHVIYDQLKQLHMKGVNIALDDFGKGYSSLEYLKRLPVTTLKIDKIFMDGIPSLKRDECITDLIVMLGLKLGLNVVGEGVETNAQFKYLKKKKCSRAQGYYFSKPVSETEAMAMV